MPRVLYLAGWGRSGTTILDNILGSYPGVFSAGELCFLWRRGLISGRRCGCGTPVRDCDLWQAVLSSAYGDDPPDPRQVVAWQDEAARARHTARILRDGHPLVDVMARLYQGIADVTGASLIIDSSKLPSGAALLAGSPSAYLVHMVRDPRAVAHSWQRPKQQLDLPSRVTLMKPHSTWDSTAKWLTWNYLTELTARRFAVHRRLRYEDFARSPRSVVEDLLGMAGVPVDDGPFLDDRTVALAANHTVSGNPGRFTTGPVAIRADEAWRRDMRPSARMLAGTLALPLRWRYRY
ncbi:sulfotransferase [Hamadaea sp. NPDC051192]|uniref:sulfotransferase n=1 Tax=Hamadaea sp. NPDC051192 TaxID=3154940 RepID=UPI00343B91CA